MRSLIGAGSLSGDWLQKGAVLKQPGAVQQLDGLPAFEAEEFFDGGAVENGDREPAEFLDDAGKVKQPKGLWGQGELPLLAIRYRTVVRNGAFRGLEYPMIIPVIEGETRFRALLYSPKPRPREREF